MRGIARERGQRDAIEVAAKLATPRGRAAGRAIDRDARRRRIACVCRIPARRTLAQLHTLDAFDPELETEARALGDALRSEVSKQIAMGRRGFASGNFTAAQRSFESVLELDRLSSEADETIRKLERGNQARPRLNIDVE